MQRVTLALLAVSVLHIVPALAQAQSQEPATDASSPPESAGTEASPADASSRAGAVVPVPQAIDEERAPNARPFSRRAVQAAERWRGGLTPQGRAASTMRDHGLVGMVMGIAGLAGGLTMIVGGLLDLSVDALLSRTDDSGVALVIAGGACAGVGLLALITGGILFSQRAQHIEPGEVSLALGPASLALTAVF